MLGRTDMHVSRRRQTHGVGSPRRWSSGRIKRDRGPASAGGVDMDDGRVTGMQQLLCVRLPRSLSLSRSLSRSLSLSLSLSLPLSVSSPWRRTARTRGWKGERVVMGARDREEGRRRARTGNGRVGGRDGVPIKGVCRSCRAGCRLFCLIFRGLKIMAPVTRRPLLKREPARPHLHLQLPIAPTQGSSLLAAPLRTTCHTAPVFSSHSIRFLASIRVHTSASIFVLHSAIHVRARRYPLSRPPSSRRGGDDPASPSAKPR